MSDTAELESPVLAKLIRAHALQMVHRANASHIGTCLSMADLLAVLYTDILRVNPNDPKWLDRDRFILSKGHGAAALYAALAEKGFFDIAELQTYCADGSRLTGHVNHFVPGVEVSTGALGHGLPIACGMALVGKRESKPFRVFALLSDGEMDEGSNWEAILFAPHHHLDNLILIIDHNKIQSFGSVKEVLDLAPLPDKLRAFNWTVREIDGHDHLAIRRTLQSLPAVPGQPTAIIAHTVKGKGISFMEEQLKWHYSSPNAEQLAEALAQIQG